MPVPSELLSVLPFVSPLPGDGPWAYAGLGPGQEFLPQFVALLALAGSALLAVLQWPFAAFFRRFRRARRAAVGADDNRQKS